MRTTVRSKTDRIPSLDDVIEFGPRLLSQSLKSGLNIFRSARDIFSQSIPKGCCFSEDNDCKIPETECPPRCVCEILWEATVGEKATCSIRVKNESKTRRIFSLTAKPFTGKTTPGTTIQLNKNSVTLNPGQSEVVNAALIVTSDFSPGRYTTEIIVNGAYEQCVCVTLNVECEQSCYCEVAQGDPPVRIRAHHWYDHFQCTEPCEPTDKKTHDDKGNIRGV